MFRTIVQSLATLTLLGASISAWAEAPYGSLISPVEARRYGLDRVWFTQVELDPARARIAGLQYFVSSTNVYTVYEVRFQGQKRVFSERDVDTFGKVVGKEGAKKQAEEFFEQVKLQETFAKLDLDPNTAAMARELVVVYRERRMTIANDKELWQSDQEKQEALKRAEEQFWADMGGVLANDQIAKLKQLLTQKPEAKLQELTIPEITLFVVTDRGMVHAIDAETGRTRWAALIGNPDYPTERPGVSEQFVAILNGPHLYLLNRATGEVAWKRDVKGVPSAGPAITDTYVIVPTFTGDVELYEIAETRTAPYLYKSNGRVLVQPIATPLSIVWPTDRGFLYVAKANSKGLRYRVEARDTIVAQPSYAKGYFFMTSIDGDVYCVHENSGNERWRFSTGEPIGSTPVPVGERLLVVTDKNTLFCIKQETGEELWWAPRIKRFVAASKDRIYGLSTANRLVILDANTGGRIASMGTELLDIFYPNLQTDRIIVGSKMGVIQCLRETQMEWPLVHAGLAEVEKKERPKIKQEGLDQAAPKPKPKQPAAGQQNPFGGANPFGGGANPFGGGQGQGGGANPFGGGQGQGGGASPFGGGQGGAKPPAGGQGGAANPFGGGNNNNPFN